MHPVPPPFDQFLTTAEQVIADRPEVDPDMIREIFREVATTLYNGLALEDLDEHDKQAVVTGLCAALVDRNPADAVRARAQATLDEPELHDPQAASATYLHVAELLRL